MLFFWMLLNIWNVVAVWSERFCDIYFQLLATIFDFPLFLASNEHPEKLKFVSKEKNVRSIHRNSLGAGCAIVSGIIAHSNQTTQLECQSCNSNFVAPDVNLQSF